MQSIEKPIVSVAVKKVAGTEKPSAPLTMHELVERPMALQGTTYKLKSGGAQHALYLTINNITLGPGNVRPYEIFINSKDMKAFQWIACVTRLMSAVFRKGGDLSFLIEEMKSIFDPAGGYWIPGGQRVESLIAEIGCVVEGHLQSIGVLEKSKVVEVVGGKTCPQCSANSVRTSEGCDTCMSCGYSKCS